VTGFLSVKLKRLEREVNHTPSSISEVMNEWSSFHIHLYIFMARCLIFHKDNFVLLYTIRKENGLVYNDISIENVAKFEEEHNYSDSEEEQIFENTYPPTHPEGAPIS
jgi:hypothetical protein